MEGTIQQLFEGHHMNYIECINVDYRSTRKESYYGICFRFKIYVSDFSTRTMIIEFNYLELLSTYNRSSA